MIFKVLLGRQDYLMFMTGLFLMLAMLLVCVLILDLCNKLKSRQTTPTMYYLLSVPANYNLDIFPLFPFQIFLTACK